MSRNVHSSLLFVFVFIFLTPILPASAGQISVTSGFLDMNIHRGPLWLGGDRGFTFRGFPDDIDGPFAPARCNDTPSQCVPGATLNLGGFWSDTGLRGTATLDGVTYNPVGSTMSNNSMTVTFSGSTTLPPLAASATLTVPFTFSGFFLNTATGSETLSGGGTATVSLAADLNHPGSWRITRVFYSLNSTIPDGWVTADVGQVSRAGDAFFSDGTFVVNGAGADIWGTADAFRFVFQNVVGDADIVARVDAESFTHSFAKAGLMFRTGTGTSDAHVILDVRPDGNVEFMTRSAANGTTTFIGGGPYTLPLWLRLGRSGADIAAAVSADGSAWTPVGTTTFTATGRFGDIVGGLAVTSHDTSVLNEARFSEVRVTLGTINLARNKPIYASSSFGPTFTPDRAVDGLGATRWSSEFSDPQWIAIDLGRRFSLTRVVLRWEAAYSSEYQLMVSDDAQTWQTLLTRNKSSADVDDLEIAAIARYIGIVSTQRGTPWGVSLFEFEVYGP